jgi:hypothetical protein
VPVTFDTRIAEALEDPDGGLALGAVLGRFLGGEGDDLLKVVGSFRSVGSPVSPASTSRPNNSATPGRRPVRRFPAWVRRGRQTRSAVLVR